MNLNILVLNFVIYLFGIKCQEFNLYNYDDDDFDSDELPIKLPEKKARITWDSRHKGTPKIYRTLNKDKNKEKQKFDSTLYNGKNTNKFDPSLYKDTRFFDIRYDEMPSKCKKHYKPRDCAEATYCTNRSGIYEIVVQNFSSSPFLVECDVKTYGGDWMVIQRREDGFVNFYRGWDEYVKGFGFVDGELFIGLEKLYALTHYNGPQELLIVLIDKNELRYAKYDHFVIGNGDELYALRQLGLFSGNAGDSLSYHIRNKFTTKDRDNDRHDTQNCAVAYTGAWWYRWCHKSNLNGQYNDNSTGKGINWLTFRNFNISIQYAKMMIRRRTF